ncbi:MAG: hypothetical protein WBF04_19935, partial [Candidatus Sulfotelmatobacter sp.]
MTYRLKVVRGELNFEAEGDKKFVLDMLARFDKASSPTPAASVELTRPAKGRPATPQLVIAKGTSPGEFIRQFHFKKHTDFVLAFGYYLEKHSGLAEFTAADVNACYYEAKMESSNTSQMIIQNIKRALLMEAKKREKASKATRKTFM